MRIKDLFTVPKGKPITEKVFYRVLGCTICSMILTMSCLVGTTWALFSVSIDNGVNEISISEVNVTVTKEIMTADGTPESGIYIVPSGATLEPGNYNVKISYNVQPDSLEQLSKAYVIFRLSDKELGYVTLGEGTEDDITAEKNLKITAETEGELHYMITWDLSQIPEGMPNLDRTADPDTQTPGTGTGGEGTGGTGTGGTGTGGEGTGGEGTGGEGTGGTGTGGEGTGGTGTGGEGTGGEGTGGTGTGGEGTGGTGTGGEGTGGEGTGGTGTGGEGTGDGTDTQSEGSSDPGGEETEDTE